MNRGILQIATTILLLFPAGSALGGVVDYAVTTAGNFGTLNLQSGAFSSIANPGAHFEDLTRVPGGPLFASDISTDLYTMNPANGSLSLIGTMGNGIDAIKLRSDGTLFGASDSALYQVNTSTGAATLIGSLGVTSAGYDLAFDNSGNLFLESNNGTTSSLYSVNQSTGHATLIGPTGFSDSVLGYDNGTLYGIAFGSPEQVITINTSTGVGTFEVNTSGVPGGSIFGLAPAAVPEPSSLTLYVIAGFVGVTIVRRHRKRFG